MLSLVLACLYFPRVTGASAAVGAYGSQPQSLLRREQHDGASDMVADEAGLLLDDKEDLEDMMLSQQAVPEKREKASAPTSFASLTAPEAAVSPLEVTAPDPAHGSDDDLFEKWHRHQKNVQEDAEDMQQMNIQENENKRNPQQELLLKAGIPPSLAAAASQLTAAGQMRPLAVKRDASVVQLARFDNREDDLAMGRYEVQKQAEDESERQVQEEELELARRAAQDEHVRLAEERRRDEREEEARKREVAALKQLEEERKRRAHSHGAHPMAVEVSEMHQHAAQNTLARHLAAPRANDLVAAFASYDGAERNLDRSQPDGVWCGAHRAKECSQCSRGHGRAWCNGDCAWTPLNEKEGMCEPALAASFPSHVAMREHIERPASLIAEGRVKKVQELEASEHGDEWSPFPARNPQPVKVEQAIPATALAEQPKVVTGRVPISGLGEALQVSEGQQLQAMRAQGKEAVEAKVNSTPPTWCGGHAAWSCQACPVGHGQEWCNGDCEWLEGDCRFRSDLVWCGGHSARSCYGCTKMGIRDVGYSWCHGECFWAWPGTCSKDRKVPETGWQKPGQAFKYAPDVQPNPQPASLANVPGRVAVVVATTTPAPSLLELTTPTTTIPFPRPL